MHRLIPFALIAALAIGGALADLPEIDTEGIETEPVTPTTPQRWISLWIDDAVPEQRDPFNLFDPQLSNFRDLLDQIDEAREDDRVTGMILNIDTPPLGWSRIQSLRRAIQEFRAADKRVIAHLSAETTGGYLLATACDEIAMVPEGALLVTGLQIDGIFLRGLLDLLGIEPDIMQVGIYKGVGDMFTERAFTEPMREAYTALLDDLWDQMIAMIAEGRGMEPAEVAAIIDQGPFTAEAAREAGLIDQLAQPSELVLRLEISTGDGFVFDEDYGEDESSAQQLSLFDLFAMFQQPPTATESGAPKIALIYATGPIIGGRMEESPFAERNIIAAEDFVDTLHECRDDETIRAVVIRIDSPGGSAIASDQIWSEIRALQEVKPVVVSMGNMAASGGYYIAMGASEIFAEPGTLTGSIGVVGGKFVLTGLLEGHLGITHDTLSRGRNAGLFSPWTPFSDSQREAMMAMMTDVCDAFTSKAAESRGLSAEQIETAAQGRLWTGRQALERGLVDHMGGLSEALARAEELAELMPAEAEELEIAEFPPPMNIMEWFMEQMTGGTQAALPGAFAGILSPQDIGALSQIHLWRDVLEQERVLAIPPVMLSIQ